MQMFLKKLCVDMISIFMGKQNKHRKNNLMIQLLVCLVYSRREKVVRSASCVSSRSRRASSGWRWSCGAWRGSSLKCLSRAHRRSSPPSVNLTRVIYSFPFCMHWIKLNVFPLRQMSYVMYYQLKILFHWSKQDYHSSLKYNSYKQN